MSQNGVIQSDSWPTRPLDTWVAPQAPICYGVVVPGPETIDGPVIIRVCDYADGPIPSNGLRRITREVHSAYERSCVRAGDLLLAIRGAVGHIAEVPEGLGDANITQDSVRLRAADEQDRDYLRHVLTSFAVQAAIQFEVVGQAVQGINVRDVRRLEIPCPPPSVRRRIAHVLNGFDQTIRLLARLIDARRRLRDGLAAELLTGRRRLPSFARRPWREVRLGDVTRESTRRNGDRLGADRVMAVTKSVGLTPMRVHTMSDSLARYKVLRPGGFAYNPMRLNIGSIARSSFKRDVLVSPDYVVFEAVPELLDPRFLDYTRRAHAWRRFMMTAGSGGVRIRIYYDDLARLRLPLPGKEEQSAIADILDTAFQEIACLTLLRETVAKQKRGLMQGLLTGKIRIKEDSHG